MPWLWSDDVARMLLERELARQDEVGEWLSHPVALAIEESDDPVEIGLRLLREERAA